MTAAVLTVSDGVSEGMRRDESGDILQELLESEGHAVVRRVVPDDRRPDLGADGDPRRRLRVRSRRRPPGRVRAARDLLSREIPFVLAGDYNICPTDDDVYDPVAFRDDALCRIEARSRFRALLYLGLTDAYRVFHRETHRYTFWDYQAGRWHRDEGLRIDHLLLSPHAADRVAACEIDKKPRAKERASDHTPIWCELAV